tara:strand:+ start:622 stop:1032 length:411 start_codon:yes stop_codon:yes gene_type:complete
MEAAAAKPRPLVIRPTEGGDDTQYLCYTHKAVKSAMGMIDSLHPNAVYSMHGIGTWRLFNLIDFTRSDCMKIMNKVIKASNRHGNINATDGSQAGYLLKVGIVVDDSCTWREARVCISMGTTTLDTWKEEEKQEEE